MKKLKTNGDYIKSMSNEQLADYLSRINERGYSTEQMLNWLNAIYISDLIKIVSPGSCYRGDFEGDATSWDEAYLKEVKWLKDHNLYTLDGIGGAGNG